MGRSGEQVNLRRSPHRVPHARQRVIVCRQCVRAESPSAFFYVPMPMLYIMAV
jgi:hypothetical protein